MRLGRLEVDWEWTQVNGGMTWVDKEDTVWLLSISLYHLTPKGFGYTNRVEVEHGYLEQTGTEQSSRYEEMEQETQTKTISI